MFPLLDSISLMCQDLWRPMKIYGVIWMGWWCHVLSNHINSCPSHASFDPPVPYTQSHPRISTTLYIYIPIPNSIKQHKTHHKPISNPSWLVVSTPLKKIWKSAGNIWKVIKAYKSHVPNHQSVKIHKNIPQRAALRPPTSPPAPSAPLPPGLAPPAAAAPARRRSGRRAAERCCWRGCWRHPGRSTLGSGGSSGSSDLRSDSSVI